MNPEQYIIDHEVRLILLEKNITKIDATFLSIKSLLFKGIVGIIVTIFIPVILHAFKLV